MKFLHIAALTAVALAGPAFAGDADAGKKAFKACKSCHAVKNGDETIVKGGKTGPNLYGIMGRQAGTVEKFKYGKSIVEAGEGGLVWDEETLIAYIHNPKAYLSEVLGSSAKSKMSYKMKKKDIEKGVDADIAAFLLSVSPDAAPAEAEAAEASN
ncbi:MAG: c-type cytochrome [Pelagimonas sp.]|jgi:cytochrome c|nr:c-type cytochrome [Pelagimonas sp.]